MLKKDAERFLNLLGNYTAQEVRKAFLEQSKKFHPDVNPTGLEMMKFINAAFDELKGTSSNSDFTESKGKDGGAVNYPEMLNKALQALQGLQGLSVEICGAWIWVGGNTKTCKEILKAAKFHYASKKKMWYFRPPDWKSKSRGSFSMENIRGVHGSESWSSKERKCVA